MPGGQALPVLQVLAAQGMDELLETGGAADASAAREDVKKALFDERPVARYPGFQVQKEIRLARKIYDLD